MDTADEYTDIFVETIEIFINHILYLRNVYPPQIFERRVIYNAPVFTSLLPTLNNYLGNVLKLVRDLLSKRELKRLELIVLDKENAPSESYLFDEFSALSDKSKSRPPVPNDEFLLNFEEDLRHGLYRMAECLQGLRKLSKQASFKIHIHTTQAGFVRITQDPKHQDFVCVKVYTPRTTKDKLALLSLPVIHSIGMDIMAEVWMT